MLRLPNFLVIGAQRSGTTTLQQGLKQHPEIYMSLNKEPTFFAVQGEPVYLEDGFGLKIVRDFEIYRALFSEVRNEKAIGEASALYLYSLKAPQNIQHYIPDAKLIAILRNPIDRAYSHFLINRCYGWEPLTDFSRALAAEEDRRQSGASLLWRYRDLGFYSQQIGRYLALFSQSQIQFFLYEDLASNAAAVFRNTFRFLGVEEAFPVNTAIRHNPSGIPKNRYLHVFLTQPNRLKRLLKQFIPEDLQAALLSQWMKRNLTTPLLDEDVRQRLLQAYREDILKTQDLIRRDLSVWLV